MLTNNFLLQKILHLTPDDIEKLNKHYILEYKHEKLKLERKQKLTNLINKQK
jgi:hypothetical protein